MTIEWFNKSTLHYSYFHHNSSTSSIKLFSKSLQKQTLCVLLSLISGLLRNSIVLYRIFKLFSYVPFAWFWIVTGVPFSGFGTLVSLIIGCIGLQVLFLGIQSEYIGLVYEEVKGRPNFVVSEKINLPE